MVNLDELRVLSEFCFEADFRSWSRLEKKIVHEVRVVESIRV